MSRKSSLAEHSSCSFSSLNSTKCSLKSNSSINNSSTVSLKSRIINIGNELLLVCQTNSQQVSCVENVPKFLSSIEQINSNIFLYFYENILGTPLIDKKYPPESIDDEIHNLQSIIDSLSMDILHEDLSHIQATAICSSKPDLLSLEYLLDIIRSIQEWISSRLESISTMSINSSSSISKISPIKSANRSKKSVNTSKNESCLNRLNRSKDRSTTVVSSLHSSTNSSLERSKTIKPSPTPKNQINSSRNSFVKKPPSFESARSSSTPRSTARQETQTVKKIQPKVKRSLSLNSTGDSVNSFLIKPVIGQESIMSSILDEAPDASAKVLDQIMKKYAKQISWFEKLRKSNSADLKVERYLNEAYRKQKLLVDLMKKELLLTQRLENLKRAKQEKCLEKAKKRESKIESARVKKYIEDLKAKEKSCLLKQKLRDELNVKKMYEETIRVKKETLLDLKKYNRDKSEERMSRQMNEIKSMENYYRNKFEILNEQIIKERQLSKHRVSSQERLVSSLKSHVKSKFEIGINNLQEQMYKENTFLFNMKSNNPLTNNTFDITNFCN